MRQRYKEKKLSIIATWAVSYLIIIIFMMGIFVGITNYFTKKLEDEIKKYNNYVFESISQNICSVINEVNGCYNNLSDNEALFRELENGDIKSYYRNNDLYAVISYINRMYTSKNIVVDIFIEKSDCVISSMGIMSGIDYYNARVDNSKISYEDWKNNCTNVAARNTPYHITTYMLSGSSKDVIVWNKQYKEGIYLSAAYDKSQFFQNFDNDEILKKFNFAIYSAMGNLILDKVSDKSVEFPNRVIQLNTLQSKDFTLYKKRISIDNIQYTIVALNHNQLYRNQILDIWNLMIVILLSLLVLSLILVICLIKRNYKPIREIKTTLGIENEKYYENIQKRISSILSKYDDAAENIKINNDIIYELRLAMIFSKSKISKEMKKIISDRNKWKNYSVIEFHIRNIFEFMPETDNEDEKYFSLKFILNNIFQELFAISDMSFTITELSSRFICLVNVKDNTDEYKATICNTVVEGIDIINKEFDVSILYSVSDIFCGTENIPTAYSQSDNMMDTILITGEKYNFNDLDEKLLCTEAFSKEEAAKLTNCIARGDFHGSLEILNSVFNNIINGKMSYYHISLIIHDITGIILKCYSAENIDNSSIIEECIIILKSLNNKAYIGEIKNKLIDLIEQLCEGIFERRNYCEHINKNNKRILDIIDYIDKNYTDTNINISTIACVFDLTPYYISKFFKKTTNMSMLDYINKLRIDKADELLKNREYTVNEIAKMVGFSNTTSFYRIYKKLRGTLPTRE